MASGGPAVKKALPPSGVPQPAHLFFKVGGQGYLLTRQFKRPQWAKMIDTHAANSLPLLRRAEREDLNFGTMVRTKFRHEIAPIAQKDRRPDVLRQVALLIERRRLYLLRLGEAPAASPKRVSDLRMDEVRLPSPAVPRQPAVPQDGDPAPRDLMDRLLIVVEGMRDVPASQLGRDAAELFATLATAGMALKIAAMLAAWIASHFTPVGWIIDVGMIGYGVWMVGVGFIDTLKRLLEITRDIQNARIRGDLKRQSAPLAKLLVEAGLTAMLAFFLKGVSKGKKGSGGGGQDGAAARPSKPKTESAAGKIAPSKNSEGTSSASKPAASPAAGSIREVNKVGGDMNCVNCSIATDATLAGRPASALGGGPFRIDTLEKIYGAKFGGPTSIGGIESQMAQAGGGARGIVFGSRGTEVGHVFNVVNQNGVVRFLDGQTGTVANVRGFDAFRLLRTN